MGGLFSACSMKDKDACGDSNSIASSRVRPVRRAPSRGGNSLSIFVEETDWSDAVCAGNIEEMKQLLNNEPDLLNIALNVAGHTALHIAVINGNRPVAKFLIDYGCDLNVQTLDNGKTPLHLAVEKRDYNTIKQLLQNNVDVTIKTKKDRTVFGLTKDSVIIRMLRKEKKLSRSNSHLTPVHGRRTSEGFVSPGMRDKSIHLARIASQEYLEEEVFESSPVADASLDTLLPESILPSQFGIRVGIELENVALYLSKLQQRTRLWNAFVGENIEIIDSTNPKPLSKLVYGIVQVSLTAEHGPKALPPPVKHIKQVWRRIRTKYITDDSNSTDTNAIPSANTKLIEAQTEGSINTLLTRQRSVKDGWAITLQQFETDFHHKLYLVAKEMREEENTSFRRYSVQSEAGSVVSVEELDFASTPRQGSSGFKKMGGGRRKRSNTVSAIYS